MARMELSVRMRMKKRMSEMGRKLCGGRLTF
jgi:hypothetical protein